MGKKADGAFKYLGTCDGCRKNFAEIEGRDVATGRRIVLCRPCARKVKRRGGFLQSIHETSRGHDPLRRKDGRGTR